MTVGFLLGFFSPLFDYQLQWKPQANQLGNWDPCISLWRKVLHIYPIKWTVLGAGSETRKFHNHCFSLPLACWILHRCLCSSFIKRHDKSFPPNIHPLGYCEMWDLPSSTCLKEGHHGSCSFCCPCLLDISKAHWLDKALPGLGWSWVTL